MPSAQVTITQLPAAGAITGTEAVPIVQNGQTVQTTTGAIAASPSQTQTFITVNQEPSLTNSRALSVGAGLGLTDGGAQSTMQISLAGAVASLFSSTLGLQAKTGASTMVGRTITGSTGVSVADGNGVSGNPTISLSGAVGSLAGLAGTGILGIVSGSSVTALQITGTNNEIDVANGTGPGNPTIGLSDNPIVPGTGAITVPVGTTGQRPGGTNGQIRYNTTSSKFEGYAGSWFTFGSGDGTVTSVDASGGTTGLSFTGGPITTSGTLTLTGTPTKATNVAGGAANQVVFQTGLDTTSFISAPVSTDTFLKWTGSAFTWAALPGAGTVTSVDVSGGSTGLTFSGGPITTSGTISMAGTLATGYGGTGLTSYTAGDIVYYATGTALSKLAIGTNGQVITSSGTAPQWTNQSSLSVGSATTATNLAGGAAGSIPYQSGAGATTFLASGTGVLVNNGGSPSYSLTPSGLTSVTVTQPPSSALQLATKQYVDDAVSSGITIHTPVRVETPTALNATYTPGGTSVTVTDIVGGTTLTFSTSPSLSVNDQIVFSSTSNGIVAGTAYYVFSVPAANQVTLSLSYNGPEITTFTNGTGLTIGGLVNAGVGAILTNAGANAAIQIDGVTLSATNRVLVYNQANAAHNGVYTVTTVGDGSTPWVLTRATNENTYKPDSTTGLGSGDYFFVQEGLTGAGESYVLTTNNPLIIGTTNLTFTQFSASQVYSAGTGLTLTGTQFSLTSPVLTSLGGTGLTSYTAGDLVYYAAGTAFSKLGIGSSTYMLTSSGSAPQWTDPATVTVGNATNATSATTATTATNVAGGAANQILYQSGAGTTTFATAPTVANTYLEWTGSAFQWSAVVAGVSSVTASAPLASSGGSTPNISLTGTVLTSNGGTGVTSYTAGDLVYYSAGTALTKLGIGGSTFLLTSSGTAPQWSDPSGVTVGNATNAGTATNANNVAVTATSVNATFYPAFVDATTGNQAVEVDSDLTYNPSTNTLTAGTMVATTGIFGGTF